MQHRQFGILLAIYFWFTFALINHIVGTTFSCRRPLVAGNFFSIRTLLAACPACCFVDPLCCLDFLFDMENIIPEKAVIHEKHEIHERNQKDKQLHDVYNLYHAIFSSIPGFSVVMESKTRHQKVNSEKQDRSFRIKGSYLVSSFNHRIGCHFRNRCKYYSGFPGNKDFEVKIQSNRSLPEAEEGLNFS
ncbi:MAG: hypothetical protein PHF56_18760 [Desulfuromonadaceae bacterium]|nr:hypothetical protein [Desulfuromonadaceae bacterium]